MKRQGRRAVRHCRHLAAADHRMAHVKICGLTQPEHVSAAVNAGARYIGFNFFPKSPRFVQPEQAGTLAGEMPPGVARVGLFVNPDDALLDKVLDAAPLDMIQLHGAESPARVAEVRARFGLPVMKAIGIATADELPQLVDYGAVADMLLVDAKPAAKADLPGGNGIAFDWQLLVGRRWLKPWILAGGLTSENVSEAIRLTGARAVDVSSGVETAPGHKDSALIERFIAAAT